MNNTWWEGFIWGGTAVLWLYVITDTLLKRWKKKIDQEDVERLNITKEFSKEFSSLLAAYIVPMEAMAIVYWDELTPELKDSIAEARVKWAEFTKR